MKDYIIRTIKKKKGDNYIYEYHDKHHKRVSSSKTKRTLQNLYLPPALDHVHINTNQSEKVLAIGKDTKGRPQYTYNKRYTKKQTREKFKHMIKLGESYQKILRKIQSDIYQEAETKDKQIAMVLRLVIDCSFRIGNEKYTRENKSYGVTTLESRHVRISGPQIKIKFRGKKGVMNECIFRNKKLSRNLRRKKHSLKNTDRIFTYRSKNNFFDIRPTDVNLYLKKFGDFTTKNFRTWCANIEFIHQLMKQSELFLDISKGSRTKIINRCIDNVAHKLHNTRSVCKSNYLDPNLLETALRFPNKLKPFRNCTTKDDYTREYIRFLK
jgi:DNA topoisomerase I